MKKTIRVERSYFISNYNILKLEEQTIEIPDKLSLNQDFIKKVYDLTFINLEINFRRYLKLLEELYTYTDDTLLKRLEELKENTVQDLTEIIKGVE